MKITVESKTITGRRKNNEDAIFAVEKKLGSHLVSLIAIADGMGGHNAGEVASKIAIDVLKERFKHFLKAEDLKDAHKASEFLKNAYEKANSVIGQEARLDISKHGMGTTLVTALCVDNFLMIANVGDSRAYILDSTRIKQVTEDHSVIAESIKSHLITVEEAENSPYQNALTRCLDGGVKTNVDIFPNDHKWIKCDKSVIVMLCSDGLSGVLTDSEIRKIFISSKNLRTGCINAINLAYKKGSQDNISVVAMEYGEVERISKINGGFNKKGDYYFRGHKYNKILSIFIITILAILLSISVYYFRGKITKLHSKNLVVQKHNSVIASNEQKNYRRKFLQNQYVPNFQPLEQIGSSENRGVIEWKNSGDSLFIFFSFDTLANEGRNMEDIKQLIYYLFQRRNSRRTNFSIRSFASGRSVTYLIKIRKENKTK